MNIKQYAENARSTAIYPNRGNNLPYAVLGLMEETFELIEKINQGDMEGLKKELGDVFWYLVALSDESKLNVESLFIEGKDAQNEALGLTFKSSPHSIAMNLADSAAKLCGVTKKIIRDDAGIPSKEKSLKIEMLAKQIFGLSQRICEEVNVGIDEILAMNIEKLFSRKARGKLSGSGDNR